MKWFITSSLMAIFLLLDLLAGNIFIFCGLSCYCALVIALAFNWKYGVSAAVAGGIILDSIYGRIFSATTIIYAAALLVALWVINRGHRQLPALLGGGAIVGTILSCGTVIMVKFSKGSLPAPDISSYMIFSCGGGALLLVLLVTVFDFFAGRANLPRCIKVELSNSGRRTRRKIYSSQLNPGKFHRRRK